MLKYLKRHWKAIAGTFIVLAVAIAAFKNRTRVRSWLDWTTTKGNNPMPGSGSNVGYTSAPPTAAEIPANEPAITNSGAEDGWTVPQPGDYGIVTGEPMDDGSWDQHESAWGSGLDPDSTPNSNPGTVHDWGSTSIDGGKDDAGLVWT